jgi:uncharacterized protein YyaL (SSP411 family)
LLNVRGARVWPGRDEKILTSWNALMIGALAQAAQVLEQPAYAQAASRAASYLLDRMRSVDGRLFRTSSTSSVPKLNGYLEDYSFLIDALVTLYEATFEPRWISAALDLTNVMIDDFWDSAEGGFFYTGRNHEALIARTKDAQDSSIPSGNAMAVTVLLRLAKLTGRRDLEDKATATLRLFSGLLTSSPLAVGQMLVALDFHLGPVEEIAIVGDGKSGAIEDVLRLVRQQFRPLQVVAATTAPAGSDVSALIPLLADKKALGDVTTYVCQNFTCQAPLVGVEAARSALSKRET